MSHPMHCPVCEEDFTTQLHYNNVDCCGDANSHISISAACPDCGFMVISEFNYDHRYSNELMANANHDTHTQMSVPEIRHVAKWMTHEEAKKFEEEEE
jgi:hypothetical protein